jgi:RNA recognition motif-containing protein
LIIYVGNLPTSWNDDDIIQYFSQYGKIIDAKLIKKMGSFNGSALVKFCSLTDA